MRIVFASLGSRGDLHPLLALARAASDRGHATAIAASVGYQGYVESQGFHFFPIRPDLHFDEKLVGRIFHPKYGPERLMREQIFPSVRDTYADLLEATKGADLLVVGELLYVAPLVAAKQGIPWANAILAPSSFLSACDPCILAMYPKLYQLRRLGRWPYHLIFTFGRIVTRRWSEPLRDLQSELGFPKSANPVFEGKHSPLLTLALFPAFFAPLQLDWPSKVVQTGFPFFAQSIQPNTEEKLNRFFSAGDPPIVFTLGSSIVQIAGDFYQQAAEAALALGKRAILLVGTNPIPAGLPDSILVLDYAPLQNVLSRAAAVVHQGGIGTCAEALRCGAPSLVIPFGFDQPDNAERLRRLGVALVLQRDRFTLERMTAMLGELTGSMQMAKRARLLAKELHPAQELLKSMESLERLRTKMPERQ